jgi:hypothetical protein
MRGVKRLGIGFAMAIGLLAFAGVGMASATTLTGPEGLVLKTGTTVHAVNEGAITLTTSFKSIECEGSTMQVATTNESGSAIEGKVESLTYTKCNCEVKVITGGTVSIASAGSSNGSVSSNGAEITASCNTIFGTVHCIYSTSNTASATLTGSSTTASTATTTASAKNIPRLTTNGLCSEEANLDEKYSIDTPDLLNVD